MPRADSDGVSIHCELAGTGDGLVLSGGLGVQTGEYRALIDALARHHRRNHGTFTSHLHIRRRR